jgi:hypothetical protein
MDDRREAADRRGEPERWDQRCRICAAARPSSQPGAHLALAGAQGNAVRDCLGLSLLPRGRPDFLLYVGVLSRLFRRLVLEKLTAALSAGALQFFSEHAALAKCPSLRGLFGAAAQQ